MNVAVSNTMPSVNAFAIINDPFTFANDVSEDENDGDFDPLPRPFYPLSNEDALRLYSHDLSLSSLDFNLDEDVSLEPTPIRMDGVFPHQPQSIASMPPHGLQTAFATMISHSFSTLSHQQHVPKRDFAALMTSQDLPQGNAYAFDNTNDDSCFIRPHKAARTVSSSSIPRFPLEEFDILESSSPEQNVVSFPSSVSVSSNDSSVACRLIGGQSLYESGNVNTLSSNISKPVPCSTLSSCTANKETTSSKPIQSLDDDVELESARFKPSTFRTYQSEQWSERFEELQAFQRKHGHCVVPHNYLYNGSPALAQWVKRQRFQWKQLIQNKRSTITEERKTLLESIGFVFDSHSDAWQIKFASLVAFKEENGHVGVPSKWPDKELAIWVKCQRRNYKLFKQGRKSAMTKERIRKLEELGFNWNPRNL